MVDVHFIGVAIGYRAEALRVRADSCSRRQDLIRAPSVFAWSFDATTEDAPIIGVRFNGGMSCGLSNAYASEVAPDHGHPAQSRLDKSIAAMTRQNSHADHISPSRMHH
jgi:hypothetical protein